MMEEWTAHKGAEKPECAAEWSVGSFGRELTP
jgi:hypothetical protein